MSAGTNPERAEVLAQRLKALAEAATPGPWKAWLAIKSEVVTSDGRPVALVGPIGARGQDQRNAEYLAAANPSAISSLCDALLRAEAALEKYEAVVKAAQACVDWTRHDNWTPPVNDAVLDENPRGLLTAEFMRRYIELRRALVHLEEMNRS